MNTNTLNNAKALKDSALLGMCLLWLFSIISAIIDIDMLIDLFMLPVTAVILTYCYFLLRRIVNKLEKQ